MRTWLIAGSGLALAIALVLGVALRPRHPANGAAEAPQAVQATAAAAPAAGTASHGTDESAANAADKLPEYALGKDWRRLASAAAGPSTPIGPDPQNYYVSPLGHPSPMAADAASAAVEASAIATADGGPPITLPVVDNEATPEAAGDTRVAQ